MFRDAAVRDTEQADRRFTVFATRWRSTENKWFDGSVESVDNRLAKLDREIAQSSEAVGRLGNHIRCASALPQLRATREQLLDLRERLLTGAVPMGLSMPREAGARSFEDFEDSLLTD